MCIFYNKNNKIMIIIFYLIYNNFYIKIIYLNFLIIFQY